MKIFRIFSPLKMKCSLIVFMALVLLCEFNAFGNQNIDSLLKQNSDVISAQNIDTKFQLANYYKNGNLNLSTKYAFELLRMATEVKDSLNILWAYKLIGENYLELGLLELAMQNLIEGKNLSQQLNDSSLYITLLNSIGNVYWYGNEFNKALIEYKKVALFASRTNNINILKTSIGNIGVCYSNLSAYDSAFYYLNKKLHLSKSLNDLQGIGWVYNHFAYNFLTQNKLDSSQYYYNKSLAYKKHLPVRLVSYIYTNLIQVYQQQKKYTLAENCIDSAWHYAYLSKSLSAQKNFYESKFDFEFERGMLDSALQSQLAINRIQDSLMTDDYNTKLSNFQSVFELEKKETEILNLTRQNQIISLKSKQQSTLLLFLLLLGLSGILILFLVFKSNRLKKKTIEQLSAINLELKNNKEELTATNEELQSQKEELYDKNREIKDTLQQLKETQTKLLQSEKMAAIGVLARGVAHELINPLNFVNGGIAILEDELESNPALSESVQNPLNMMNEGITRAVHIVRQLSSFVDQGDSLPQIININDVVDNSLIFLKYRIDLQTRVEKKYGLFEAGKCYVEKIHNIMFQLLINAIDEVKKASGEKIIHIETSMQKADGKDFYKIIIFNTGSTIPEPVLSKIFDPFFTTKSPNQGVGMGLTIVYNLVTEIQGKIEVHNRENGVEFIVLIPRLTE